MSNIEEKELSWDAKIEKESEFTLLPEGDYYFTVVSFERGRHGGSAKLPPCNMALLTIRLTGAAGEEATITHRLYLHTRCEGLLSAFFIAIGQKKHGEPLRMDWSKVTGATGRCKVGVHLWKKDNGEEMKSNEIKRFYEPDSVPAPAPTNPAPTAPGGTTGGIYTPGKF